MRALATLAKHDSITLDRPPHSGEPWTDSAIKELQDYYVSGKTFTEIGEVSKKAHPSNVADVH